MTADDLEARYAERRPPEPFEELWNGKRFILHTCYVCGELVSPDTGRCRDCGATWDVP